MILHSIYSAHVPRSGWRWSPSIVGLHFVVFDYREAPRCIGFPTAGRVVRRLARTRNGWKRNIPWNSVKKKTNQTQQQSGRTREKKLPTKSTSPCFRSDAILVAAPRWNPIRKTANNNDKKKRSSGTPTENQSRGTLESVWARCWWMKMPLWSLQLESLRNWIKLDNATSTPNSIRNVSYEQRRLRCRTGWEALTRRENGLPSAWEKWEKNRPKKTKTRRQRRRQMRNPKLGNNNGTPGSRFTTAERAVTRNSAVPTGQSPMETGTNLAPKTR